MKILCIGDIVGRPGRKFIKENLNTIIAEKEIDFVIANGENSAGGVGITKDVYEELLEMKIDVITLGNHAWAKREIFDFINEANYLVRPANYSNDVPGKGYITVNKNNKNITVINLCGRVFMENLECPFKTIDNILQILKDKTDIIIVDFHAEATSEKLALAYYLDGRVTAIFGTHTHVQTSDERVLPLGTGYITDVGMTGPRDSVLGVKKEIIIQKFKTMLPAKFELENSSSVFGAVIFNINNKNNSVDKVERLNIL